MLLEIREKVQGVFASIILALICVLFGLWGIQNYLGGGKETPEITVGDKEFFQRDINQAYQQFAQNLAGMKFDEDTLKKQALQKLIRDEVLLQYAQERKLVITDDVARDFIQTLEYFQKDGKFDKTQYQTLLGSQGMSSDEFVGRIKKALMMEQVQRAVVDSGFVTKAEVAAFFKIQNQKRDVEYITVPLSDSAQVPAEEDISAYYQQHQDAFQTEEQVSIQYVELALDALADEVDATEDQLQGYYEEQKAQFSNPERRKISHILFAFGKDGVNEEDALRKALQAKQDLAVKDFAALAAEISDDKLSAKNGGDLGLFNVGVMEKAFEDAASQLKLGEVSEPVKSAFGYHLIKVTELVPGEVKAFAAVKPELTKAYKKSQAEAKFAGLAEKLGEVSYENPDSLEAAAALLGVAVKETPLFSRNAGADVAADEKVRLAAFSEDVLKGKNSEPVEVEGDKVIVLRMKAHLPAATKELKDVRSAVIASLQKQNARQRVAETANKLKDEILAGKSIADVARNAQLTVKKVVGLARTDADIDPMISQAVFRAAKPTAGQPSMVIIDDSLGGKVVAGITNVTAGEMSEADKAKQAALEKSMATAFGRAQFEAVLNQLQASTDIRMRAAK
ncbi:SurA N-terminal domain-containing protein [Methylomonas sp. SURF-2]|uniref:Periplasmic chaperone PpiD n=1 Tax=Methylomonas subterranea TaxID=2952225 RepID=A0ABT1TGG8_9GAMM|nr:SurA N-terminal domain-containing protein [Methylomonas sp. SURF-2]MCQ8104343.1 SurA N-terminal domain-containing protein [Methylomonas sp. SURF-2]